MAKSITKEMINSVGGPKTYFGKGVYIKEYTIIGAKDLSNYPLAKDRPTNYVGSSNFRPQICLALTVIDEYGEESEKYLFGNFAYDYQTKEYKGWKFKKNPVAYMLVELGLNGNALLEDDSLNPDVLKKLKGKKIIMLQYCSAINENKPKFNTYYVILDADKNSKEDLYEMFIKEAPYLNYVGEEYEKFKAAKSQAEAIEPIKNDSNSDDIPF